MPGVAFTSAAFDDYNEWAITDKQVFKRLVSIINNIQRDPFRGIGKPEPLKHQFKVAGAGGLQINTDWFIR